MSVFKVLRSWGFGFSPGKGDTLHQMILSEIDSVTPWSVQGLV